MPTGSTSQLGFFLVGALGGIAFVHVINLVSSPAKSYKKLLSLFQKEERRPSVAFSPEPPRIRPAAARRRRRQFGDSAESGDEGTVFEQLNDHEWETERLVSPPPENPMSPQPLMHSPSPTETLSLNQSNEQYSLNLEHGNSPDTDEEDLENYIDRDEQVASPASSFSEDTPQIYTPESQSLLQLLHSIAEDQSRKDGVVHRSITCNHCGTSPVRGFRFKCANCVDYDLCENCESLDVHDFTHSFLKIRVPIPPLSNPRQPLMDPLYPGKLFENSNKQLDYEKLEKITHFDRVEIDALYSEYKSLSTVEEGDGGITKQTFDGCLGPMGVEHNLITERIFDFFDENRDGIISFDELAHGVSILCKGSLDERIKYAFRGYDLNGDGLIQRHELELMFKAYFNLSMELVRDVVRAMEEGMMESFDDEASKPVSAAFSAPIPSSSDQPATRKKKLKSTDSDQTESLLIETAKRKSLKTIIGQGTRHFKSPYQRDSPLASPIAASPEQLTQRIPSTASSYFRQMEDALTPFGQFSPYYFMDLNYDEHYPVMEAMSQEAIEEMVSKTLAMANSQDSLTFDDFVRVVQEDSNLLAWFEALGSVF